MDIPELEKSILDIGGNINYKHFYIPKASEDHESHMGELGWWCQGARSDPPS